jgi:hypothetical protein
MPVQKFRTFDEARRALWVPADAPDILRRMQRLGALARARRPIRRGVTRLRTIGAAKLDKGAAWQVRPDLDAAAVPPAGDGHTGS